jgi:enoyl-CoA hydratase/carnithine racemase
VHEIAADPIARALAVGETLAAWSPTALRAGIGFAQEVRGRSWNDAGDLARLVRNEIFESADFQEGIRAFREKRKPKWPTLEYSADKI